MTEDEIDLIEEAINYEGFGYAMAEFDFHEVKDKEFHKRFQNFLEAKSELLEYLSRYIELSDDPY